MRICAECGSPSGDKPTCRFHVELHERRWNALCLADNYRITNLQRLIDEGVCQHKLKSIMAWDYAPRGLIVYGPTGLGKTRSCWLVVRRWFDLGKSVSMFNSVDFANEVNRRFGDGEGPDWIESIQANDILFLDDLDKAKLTERVETELYGLIEHFTSHSKPLIVTCNSTGDQFMSKFSPQRADAIYRRLKEFCRPVHLTKSK